MTQRTTGTESRINSAALYLSASFFVVLGAINIVHNVLPLFRVGNVSWWPVLMGIAIFGVLPLGFGVWLVWNHDDRQASSSENNSQESRDSDRAGKP